MRNNLTPGALAAVVAGYAQNVEIGGKNGSNLLYLPSIIHN